MCESEHYCTKQQTIDLYIAPRIPKLVRVEGRERECGQGWARAGLFKAGTASAQLVDVSGATADGYRAAFLAGIATSERVAATSQPTPMSPHHKPPMISQLRRTRLAGLGT